MFFIFNKATFNSSRRVSCTNLAWHILSAPQVYLPAMNAWKSLGCDFPRSWAECDMRPLKSRFAYQSWRDRMPRRNNDFALDAIPSFTMSWSLPKSVFFRHHGSFYNAYNEVQLRSRHRCSFANFNHSRVTSVAVAKLTWPLMSPLKTSVVLDY